MKGLSDSSSACVDFEHDDVEVLQAVYENNWKIFSYLKATIKLIYFELLQPIIVTHESCWRGLRKERECQFFALRPVGISRRPGHDLSYCEQQPMAAQHTLTALRSHWSFPERTLEKALIAHCLKARRQTWKQLGRFLRHLLLSSWKTEHLCKDRLLITQKRPNSESKKNSRWINLDQWKTQEALTSVVLN